jgi:hypothetical protein
MAVTGFKIDKNLQLEYPVACGGDGLFVIKVSFVTRFDDVIASQSLQWRLSAAMTGLE